MMIQYLKNCLTGMALLLPFLSSAQSTTLNISVVPLNPTCFNYTNGTATATVSNGTPPYLYTWSNGQPNGRTVQGIGAGNYSLTVTDALGNRGTQTFLLTQPTRLVAAIAPESGGACAAAGTTFRGTATGGNAPYTYSWGGVNNSNRLVSAAAGQYYLTVTDANNCQASQTLRVNSPFSVSVRSVDVVCGGLCDGSGEAITSGGTAPITFNWSWMHATNQVIFPLPGGDYTVTATDAAGCQTSASGHVGEPPPIDLRLTISNPCSGTGSASINPTGGAAPYTVRWSTGATSNSVTGLTTGYYNVSVTDASFCTKVGMVAIANISALTLTPATSNAACAGVNNGSVNVNIASGLAPYTYLWSNGATNSSITSLPVGTYTVTVTDGAGCTKSVTTTVNPNTTVGASIFGTTNSACGANTGTATALGNNGTAPYTYRWDNAQTTPNATGLSGGYHSVQITDALGCTASAFTLINSTTALLSTTSVTNTTCGGNNGTSTISAVSGGTGTYSYRWDNGQTSATATGLSAGIHYVTISDANNCVAIRGVVIGGSINAPFSVATSTTNACNGISNGRASVSSVTGGTAPYTYRWDNNQTGTSATGLSAGTHTVSVTDALGCMSITNLTVGAGSPIAIAETTHSAMCSMMNGSMTLSATGGTAPYTYTTSAGNNQTGIFNNLAAGSYQVTATDAVGCSASLTGMGVIVMNMGNVTANFANTAVTCVGDSMRVRFTNQSSGDLSGSTISWLFNNGTTSSVANPEVYFSTLTGQARLVVTSTSGCSDTLNRSFPVDIIDVSVPRSLTSCPGRNINLAVVNNNANNTPTYQWTAIPSSLITSGANTANPVVNIGANGATRFFLTSTNAAGCRKLDTTTVNVSSLVLTPSVTASGCTGATSGSASIAVSSGTSPYTYAWSNGGTTANLSALGGGTYTVTVTDATGCSNTTSARVLASSPITANTAFTNAQCSGANGTATVSNIAGGAGAGFTYRWDNGQTGLTATGLASGPHSVTISDVGGGCTSVLNVTVGSSTPSFVVNTTSTATCSSGNTGTATFSSVTGGTSPYRYLWDNGQTTLIASGLSSGTHTVTITDANQCQTVQTFSVGVTTISLLPASTNALCGQANGSITLVGSGGTAPYTYRLGGVTTTNQTGTFSGLVAGSYLVTITDANGCAFSPATSVSVANTGNISAALVSSPLSCTGDSLRIRFSNQSTGAPTTGIRWLFSNGTTSTAANPEIFFSGTTGAVRLEVTSAAGCMDTITRIFPVDVVAVSVQAGPVSTCIGSAVTLRATNNNPNYTPTYQWSPANLITAGANTASPTVSPNVAGSPYIYLTSTNALGCVKRDSVQLNVASPTSPSFSFTQSCDNSTINFTSTSVAGYRWSFGTGNAADTSRLQNPSFTYPTGGSFTVTMQPQAACLSPVSLLVPVRAGAAVTLTKTDTAVCSRNPIVLRVNTNFATNTVEWSANRGFVPISGTGTSYNATPTRLGQNLYYVRSTDANGCQKVDSVLVTDREIVLNHDSVVNKCLGVNKQFTFSNVNSAAGTVGVVWTPEVTGGLQPTITSDNVNKIVGLFSNQYGCTLRDSVRVAVTDLSAQYTLSPALSSIIKDQTQVLTLTGGKLNDTYAWSNAASLSCNNCKNPVASPAPDSAIYTVTITDANGCVTTKTAVVKVLDALCSEPYIYIPNAFSPNADNVNEKLFVRGQYLSEVYFAVYNRWGELVFETNDIKVGWDGTHKGTAVCPDVYGYYMTGRCKKGEAFFKKGNVTVLK
jgi:gliding motility-associated-like protein